MSLRTRETNTIARFLHAHRDKLRGQVLDLGCGKQPYRKLIEDAGGEYTGHDRPTYPGSVVDADTGPPTVRDGYDAIVMTQVWQYIPIQELIWLMRDFANGEYLRPGGWLLATGPTNWPVVEKEDLHRFTPDGVLALLDTAGFPLVEVQPRHHVMAEGERWLCGWGVAARSAQ